MAASAAAAFGVMMCVQGALLLPPPPPACAASSSSPSAVLRGPARVVDGDTLEVQGQKIRLFGVDAPEKAQSCRGPSGSEYPCGLASKTALEAKLQGKSVSCSVNNLDQYGRSVSKCTVSRGGLLGGGGGEEEEEINAWLVKNGLAVAYKQYGGKTYADLEDKAKAAHLGIWQGTFETPSEWRKDQKALQGGRMAGGAPMTMMAATAASSSLKVPPLLPSAPPLAAATLVPPPGRGEGGLGGSGSTSSSRDLSACSDGSLPIKGNISGKGSKIYHIPGSAAYNQVKIDEGAGERFFCSEEEARAAGWKSASK